MIAIILSCLWLSPRLQKYTQNYVKRAVRASCCDVSFDVSQDCEHKPAKPLVIHKWFANELPESLGFTVKSTPCKPRLVLKS